MYLRFVRMNVLPGKLDNLIRMYNSEVVPVLQNTKGCRYASLIRSNRKQGECISMTLWDEKSDAEAYEKSGTFQQLYEKLRPLLEDSSEWKIQLKTDYTLDYLPESEKPVVDSYDVPFSSSTSLPPAGKLTPLYVRILSARVKPDRRDELTKIYKEEIGPGLQQVEGCKYAFLTQNLQDENEFFSITIWESEQAAERYEKSGKFEEFVEKIENTLAKGKKTGEGLVHWKMKLSEKEGNRAVTSEDPSVEPYTAVIGRQFT